MNSNSSTNEDQKWISLIVVILVASAVTIIALFLFMRRKVISLQRENADDVQQGEQVNIQEIDDNAAEQDHSISVENDERAEGVAVEPERTTQALEIMQDIGDV